jgi:hypothetical protein
MSHVALDFDEALENFKTMFPGVPEDIITDLLRRENGDVEKVVNELLAFSSNPTSSRASGSSARNSDIFYLEPPPPYSEVCKKQESQPTFSSRQERQEPSKSTPSSSRSSTTTTTQNETIDDEKIALMIQNEEFLNYLRNNPTFMREIYGARMFFLLFFTLKCATFLNIQIVAVPPLETMLLPFLAHILHHLLEIHYDILCVILTPP